jgi:hypothetical protein
LTFFILSFQGRRGSEPNLAKRNSDKSGSTGGGVTAGKVQAAVANFNAITQTKISKPLLNNDFVHFGSVGRSFSAHHMATVTATSKQLSPTISQPEFFIRCQCHKMFFSSAPIAR